jgi:hypothetical protein
MESWREGNCGGIYISRTFRLHTLLFTDSHEVTTKTEDELQCKVNNLQITASESDMSFSV